MNGLLASLKSLGAMRLAIMAAVAVGMLATLGMLATRGGNTQMSPLYADLDLKDSAAIVDQLTKSKITASTDQNGTRVLVPSDQLDNARLALARAGLPNNGSEGWEIFDKSSDLLSESQFQQNINQTRALEGELTRTITLVSGIRAARVNLVLPTREPFSRDTQEAQASVLLTTAGTLDRDSVQAVLNLVASAVPGLKTKNVTIVDSAGNLLARAGEPIDGTGSSMTADELKSATETRLASAVEDMLGRTLGPDHVRATANVEMDFDHSQETTEKYDPDQQVARSTQTITTNSKTSDATPNVSVQNNLPNATPTGSSSGTTDQHSEEVTNYEIGKTVSTLVHDQPQIKRISVAVMVDGTSTVDDKGKISWQPLPASQLADITSLVKSAIGYDDQRGDKVDVTCLQFINEAPLAPAGLKLLGMQLEKPELMQLAETGLIGVLAIIGLMFIVRPTLLKLVATPQSVPSAALGEIGHGGTAALAAGEMARLPGGAGGTAMTLAEESGDDMVTVANIEGQMKASSMRRLAAMVEKDPETTLSIIRGWISAEAG